MASTNIFNMVNYFHDIFNFFVWDYQRSHAWSINIFWKAASFNNAAAVNPNAIKMFLTNSIGIFYIDGKQNCVTGPRKLPSNFDL